MGARLSITLNQRFPDRTQSHGAITLQTRRPQIVRLSQFRRPLATLVGARKEHNFGRNLWIMHRHRLRQCGQVGGRCWQSWTASKTLRVSGYAMIHSVYSTERFNISVVRTFGATCGVNMRRAGLVWGLVLERFPHVLTRRGFPCGRGSDSSFLLDAGGQHGWHGRFHRTFGIGSLRRLRRDELPSGCGPF
jgi:hypothetical protein